MKTILEGKTSVISKHNRSPCQFDWRDDVTLFCPLHVHYIITIISGRARTLRRLLAAGLLARDGQAWRDAMMLKEE